MKGLQASGRPVGSARSRRPGFCLAGLARRRALMIAQSRCCCLRTPSSRGFLAAARGRGARKRVAE
eukprot:8132649-Alexandrium_andersonii.AAC.1